jgi:hypothetical protein
VPLEERRARLPKALRGAGKALRFSETLRATTSHVPSRVCARPGGHCSKHRVHLRVADFSKLLAIEDKTPVHPRATYSLPA